MQITVLADRMSIAAAASAQAATLLRDAISRRGVARLIAATGTSQFEFLDSLTASPDLDWGRVELFHLDEYLGLPGDHPASFRRFLKERLIDRTGIERVHLLDGQADPQMVIQTIGAALLAAPVDLALVGIGENGHLAFNDPPADFETHAPYLVVTLDEVCRRQQVGEGWFPDLAAVPERALSMSVRQILKSREIICLVPDARKARAVQVCFDGPVDPAAPASILRTHPRTTVYLDRASASLLGAATTAGAGG